MKNLIAFTTITLATVGAAHADVNFPNRPVTLVVPYSAGGTTDLLARQLASGLQEIWGQPVIVENRGGAGSMLGTAYVAQARPDGYTLLYGASAQATAPAVYPSLPFDPVKDVRPIIKTSYSPFLIVGGNHLDANNMQEFLNEAREKQLFVATAGLGSATHMAAELFLEHAGLDLEVVHYAGGGEAVIDLMGGHADIYIGSTAGAMAAVNNRQVKPLGILGTDRFDALPEVQTTAEAGVAMPEITIWQAISGPASLPDDLVDKIESDLRVVMDTPPYQQMLETNYTLPGNSAGNELARELAQEAEMWRELAKRRSIIGG